MERPEYIGRRPAALEGALRQEQEQSGPVGGNRHQLHPVDGADERGGVLLPDIQQHRVDRHVVGMFSDADREV